MILTKPQALAIHKAITDLRKHGGRLLANIEATSASEKILAWDCHDGAVVASKLQANGGPTIREDYTDLAQFAAAYDLTRRVRMCNCPYCGLPQKQTRRDIQSCYACYVMFDPATARRFTQLEPI